MERGFDVLLAGLALNGSPRMTNNVAEVTRSDLGSWHAGKVQELLDGLFQPLYLPIDDLSVLHIQGTRPLRPKRRLHQQLDARQGIANLMGDTGRQLPDLGKLFGPQEVSLLLLQSLGNLLDLMNDELHLLFQSVKVAVGHHANRADILIKMLRQILNPYTEPIDGTFQSPSHAVANDEAANRTGHTQEQHNQIALTTGTLTFHRTFAHLVFVEFQQILARLDDKPDRMGVGNLVNLGQRSAVRVLDEL